MTESRPAIPADIRRQVRQRCGFGCVICGCPIYQIDHIRPWAEVREHDAENMTLLCGSCHDQKTKGLISPDRARECNEAPVNLQRGATSPMPLLFDGDSCDIIVGNNLFKNHSQTAMFAAIMIDGVIILGFGFHDHRLLPFITLYDDYNRLYLTVSAGWLVASVAPWDIKFSGNTLAIRDAPGQIRIEVAFEPPCRLRVNRGMFLRNGVAVSVSEHGVECLNNGQVFSGCDFASNGFGLGFGYIPEGLPGCVGTRNVRRYSDPFPRGKRPKALPV